MIKSVLQRYGLEYDAFEIQSFGSGLINNTWKLSSEHQEYILQRINSSIFKDPGNIAHNIKVVAQALKNKHPDYKFIAPVVSVDGDEMIFHEGEGFFRLFPFVANSYTTDVVANAAQAFEAATQFGRFTKLLAHAAIDQLKITIPFFHDLSLRYHQFETALEKGNQQRIKESARLISIGLQNRGIVSVYEAIQHDPQFKLRVTHHDTKISNVLFDNEGKGLCVIDLDTIMPGYFISDVGDMMRTYLSPVSEEEKDFEQIFIRQEIYKAIVQGYYNEMKHELTGKEKGYFFFAARFMIYMQALRFLTDHLNNDMYYGVKYKGQNRVRAENQFTLLERLLEKETELASYDIPET